MNRLVSMGRYSKIEDLELTVEFIDDVEASIISKGRRNIEDDRGDILEAI